MQEIILPEMVAGFFIAVSLIRFFINKLENLEGMKWLPFLALGILIALFPAYGFRPECIPLVIHALFCAAFHVPDFVLLPARLRRAGFLELSPFCRVLLLFLLLPVLGLAVFFAPSADPALLEAGVASAALRDEERGVELFLRIYGAYDNEAARNAVRGGTLGSRRPILVLIPPVSGSVGAVDQVCGELRNAGFTVVAYSRRGFDSPAVGPRGKKYPLSLNRRARLFWVESRGRAAAPANAAGRFLEAERRRDIQFLLNTIMQKSVPVSGTSAAVVADALAETDPSTVFLAGYDAGGAALLELAGVPDFAARYPAVKGLIAVESPLLSSLTSEEPPPAPPPHDNWFVAFWVGVRSRALALLPKKIVGVGEVPGPDVPVCFVLSDRVMEPRYRNDRYATILKALYNTKGPAMLAAAAGAGPLDYSDIPEKYPLYRVFRPGRKRNLARGTHGPEETAALMTNFAAAVLAMGRDGAEETIPALPRKPNMLQNFHIETNDRWNSLGKGPIL